MGLMLSVIVFCVGVAEMLDCWQHFLLYLVQPQHNPLPYHFDSQADILSERELTPTSDTGRPSKVDICWPKDLLPTDNLHVIKKRPHNESERKHEHEPAGHHSTRHGVLHDKHSDPSQVHAEKSFTPTIQIHCIDDDGTEASPVTSRENSPGLLELDVIIESDTSSEFDEPSQIENIAYVTKSNNNLAHTVDDSNVLDSSKEQSIRCGSNEETQLNSSLTNEPEDCFARPTLPINAPHEREAQIVDESLGLISGQSIVLRDIPIVNESVSVDSSVLTPYYSEEENNIISNIEQPCELVRTKNWVSEDISEPSESETFYSVIETQSESVSQNKDDLDKAHMCSRSADEVSPTTEVPEVTIRESSPVPLDESTDSSLNTSDASWMVRSRTSDRPLVIRFNPETAASDFMSVTKTDLQAFDSKHSVVKTSEDEGKESPNVISGQSTDMSGGKGTGSRERPLQTPQTEESLLELIDLEEPNGLRRDNFGVENKTSTQLETNSSSSSLSGIPQLPEDVKDPTTTSLPSNNGYGNSSVQVQGGDLETSYSGSDNIVQTSSNSLGLEVVCYLDPKQSKTDSKSDTNSISDTNNILQVTDTSNDLEYHENNQQDLVRTAENIEHICVQPSSGAIQERNSKGDCSNSCMDDPSNQPSLESSKELPVDVKKSDVQTDEPPSSGSVVQPSQQNFAEPSDEDISITQLPLKSETPEQELMDKIQSKQDADFKPKPIKRRDTKFKSTFGNDSVQIQGGDLETSYSGSDNMVQTSSNSSSNNQQDFVGTAENHEHIFVQPSTGAIQERNSKGDCSNSGLHNPSNPPSLESCKELPVDVKKSDVQTDEPPSSGPVVQPRQQHFSELSDEDISITQPPLKSETPEQEVIDKIQIEEDADFKPKPIQRRDTKRKSKITPRTFSRENSTKSEEAEVLCQVNEPSDSNSPTTSGPSRTTSSQQENEDSANPSSLGKPTTSSTLPTTQSPDHPAKLIFSGEYTKAMNKDWHSGHFCCWQCDESLTGQRYVLRDEHPYCIKCYESVFANGCEECNKTIGIDSKDLSYKDKHWHEACFLCNKCRVSLVDKQFGSKLDKIFCANCYDAQFASRCDGCGQIFKAGTKKMEYKTRQWHEPCFACCVCKTAIGTKSFIPREQEIYCATCYEEKFATRCVKCNKIITSGGVTYKNEPWHRECFTCTNCSTSLAGQRFTSRDEKPYCADCFGELFAKRCTACCKPITGIGGTRFISFEDRHWHNDCFICASCKTSLVGRGFITDAEDIICPECAKQKLM